MPTVTLQAIAAAVQVAGLAGKALCVHSSLRSFGRVEGGAPTVVQALLDQNCTLLVPTFSWSFAVPPPADLQPQRNGWDYAAMPGSTEGVGRIYDPRVDDLDDDMGAIPRAVLALPHRLRGDHPLCSFTAVGPHAAALISQQRPRDVWAPLRALAARDGQVVLMGVGLDKLTALHLAEQMAGRKNFLRWANDHTGAATLVEVGGCSDGFDRLDDLLAPLEMHTVVGASHWRIFPLQQLLAHASDAIRAHPAITQCADAACERCRDAVAGGPLT